MLLQTLKKDKIMNKKLLFENFSEVGYGINGSGSTTLLTNALSSAQTRIIPNGLFNDG
jgi:hypothetical protein